MSRYNPRKPDCLDCNHPPMEQWAHAHDPYGRRCMPRCDSCQNKHHAEMDAYWAEIERANKVGA